MQPEGKEVTVASKTRLTIAEYVLTSLRAEVMPWRSDRGIPVNPATGKNYLGVNALTLDAVATQRKYRNKWWATYHQWKSAGMQVAKRPENYSGEWGIPVVSWEENRMKRHTVFNAEQVFGRELKNWLTSQIEPKDYSIVDATLNATGAIFQEGESPLYDRAADLITLPPRSFFRDDPQFYATKIHELLHWAEERTGWDSPEDQGELAAEIGTGYVESYFQIPHDTDLTNCRKWLSAWISGIEKSPQYLFKAAAQAARASNVLICALQPQKIVV